MESDRVEMSVGSGIVNGGHLVNGVTANGSSLNTKSHPAVSSGSRSEAAGASSHTNGEIVSVRKEDDGGTRAAGGILKDAPPELLQVLSSEFYLPMARLVSRSAQSCWNDLLALVDRLGAMPAPIPNTSNAGLTINDQSKVNLDKKDELLNFAKIHKDAFIKLLVLLQWSRKSEEVRKTIELNLWLQQRRQAFNNATGMLGAMLRGLADSQVPNPDLYTASEVLATGGVSSMPKLDYIPQPPLDSTRILRLLKRLDTMLCTRMALLEDLSPHLQDYTIHDGRVTFTVPDEFSFDVSVASEDPQAKFGMVDFTFLFTPTPPMPDGLHDEISYIANSALDKDGFLGVYDFMHDLTLSYKLNELASQARRLSQGLWNGHLKVEVLRRTLVVQYWIKSSIHKSWLEIGIHSGRNQDTQTKSSDGSNIKLRWLREGKLSLSEEISIDLSRLTLEDVLRQVIAQHTNDLFDAIYNKFSSSPIYDSGALELIQTISSNDPAECTLEVQLSKTDTLTVSMEPISGSLILSPVSERTSRLQFDLLRSKSMVDEFASRLSSLRSSTAESNLIKSLPNSEWQRLEGIRVNLAEAEKLFGLAVTRATCIRLPQWTPEWMVTVTQTIAGDLWWLTQSVRPNSIVGARADKVVESNPLYLIGSPSPAYLERFADFTTGLIALRCNAEFLNNSKLPWRLPETPPFEKDSRLPSLQFSRASTIPSPSLKDATKQQPAEGSRLRLDPGSVVHLTYHGIDRRSKKVTLVARFTIAANPAVLKDLASSKLDQSVAIIPDKQQFMIKIQSDAGVPIIEGLIAKMSHLENITACAAAVKRSTEHALQSLSLSSITILYHKQPDLSLCLDFGHNPEDFSATFLPANVNPQRHLSHFVVTSMKRKGYSSNQNLSTIFVVLRMTQPILSYLQNIQSPVDLHSSDAGKERSHLRMHVLHRQPTAYGIHYFSDSSNFARDDIGPGTPKKLLARFEIISMNRGDQLMWMIRPAIEEFNTYNRPSYTSQALRERLDSEIFKKQSSLWLALDGGAACPSDKPEQLLSAIHTTIVKWVKEAVKPETAEQRKAPLTNGAVNDGSTDKNSNRPNAPVQKVPNTQQRPNGVSRGQQSSNQQRPGPFGNKNQASRQPDVITLD